MNPVAALPETKAKVLTAKHTLKPTDFGIANFRVSDLLKQFFKFLRKWRFECLRLAIDGNT